MSDGLVVGKFLPFHLGHRHLIATAREACDHVTVVVIDAGWHDIPLDLRVAWIAESFPDVSVLTTDQDQLGLADDDSPGWAAATLALLDRPPDRVFTSEDYGPAYARHLGCEHVSVDRDRSTVPVSGRAIRAAPLAHLDYLEPHVRAHYVLRVCIVGAESTGKTTLAAALAEHYGVRFVAEFGRHYTEAMPSPTDYRWSTEDFLAIAEVQHRFEDDAARWIGPLLICDTNAFVTSVFHEVYLGARSAPLEGLADGRRYGLWLLCDIDTPFQHDTTGLRHEGAARKAMHRRYVERIGRPDTRSAVVSGAPAERLQTAVAAIDAALAVAVPE